MATLEQLQAALVKADAAGNTADAKALADAIRQMRATSAPLPQSLQPSAAQVSPDAIPGARQEPTTIQRVYQSARPYVAPTIEALGAVGGGLIGAGAGTLVAPGLGTATGAVGGAGLGYGMAKELLELGDVYLGGKAPRQGMAQVTEPVRNVLEGTAFEAGGRVAGPLIAKGVGKLADLRQIPANKAANLARAALGKDLEQTLEALRTAPPNASVAEVTARIQNPAWQAVVRDSLERSPTGAQYLNKFAQMSHDEGVNALARLAGGTTAAEARGTTTAMKEALNVTQGPAREAALSRANLGKAVAQYETEAERLAAEAAGKVQQVRTLEGAKAKAIDAYYKYGVDEATGQIIPGQRATHMGNLAQDAERWASKAADASLDLGQGARFAQAAADSLRSVGIKPLKGDEVIGSIRAIANNPEFAGNDLLLGAVKNVADDIAKWSNSGGVIDARALDAIRKNSINAAIQQLRPGVDATTQRNLAAEVMGKLKPTLIDAIEAAGGTGYRQYLTDYAKGMQQIAERKLSGEAMRLWKTDKDAFVRLVQNEAPDVVEKFLGPGNYNIATELSENTLSVLQSQAEKRIAQLAASKQATDGEKALTTLLRENTSRFRLPSWLSFWGAAANKTISELEKAVGSKSMKVMAEAMQSPEGAKNLLERLPAEERSRVLQLISDPAQWAAMPAKDTLVGGAKSAQRSAEAIRTGVLPGTVNALAPDRYNNNAMANQPIRIVETQD